MLGKLIQGKIKEKLKEILILITIIVKKGWTYLKNSVCKEAVKLIEIYQKLIRTEENTKSVSSDEEKEELSKRQRKKLKYRMRWKMKKQKNGNESKRGNEMECKAVVIIHSDKMTRVIDANTLGLTIKSSNKRKTDVGNSLNINPIKEIIREREIIKIAVKIDGLEILQGIGEQANKIIEVIKKQKAEENFLIEIASNDLLLNKRNEYKTKVNQGIMVRNNVVENMLATTDLFKNTKEKIIIAITSEMENEIRVMKVYYVEGEVFKIKNQTTNLIGMKRTRDVGYLRKESMERTDINIAEVHLDTGEMFFAQQQKILQTKERLTLYRKIQKDGCNFELH